MYNPEYEDTLASAPRRRPIRNIKTVVREQGKVRRSRSEVDDEYTPYIARAEDRRRNGGQTAWSALNTRHTTTLTI